MPKRRIARIFGRLILLLSSMFWSSLRVYADRTPHRVPSSEQGRAPLSLRDAPLRDEFWFPSSVTMITLHHYNRWEPKSIIVRPTAYCPFDNTAVMQYGLAANTLRSNLGCRGYDMIAGVCAGIVSYLDSSRDLLYSISPNSSTRFLSNPQITVRLPKVSS